MVQHTFPPADSRSLQHSNDSPHARTGPHVWKRIKSEVVAGVSQTPWPGICWRQGHTRHILSLQALAAVAGVLVLLSAKPTNCLMAGT